MVEVWWRCRSRCNVVKKFEKEWRRNCEKVVVGLEKCGDKKGFGGRMSECGGRKKKRGNKK